MVCLVFGASRTGEVAREWVGDPCRDPAGDACRDVDLDPDLDPEFEPDRWKCRCGKSVIVNVQDFNCAGTQLQDMISIVDVLIW